LLGKQCPRLATKGHGAWYARFEASRSEDGRRRQPRVGPFRTEREAKAGLAEALARPVGRGVVLASIGGIDPTGYYVYLLWAVQDDDTPLYVGASGNILQRLGAHLTPYGPPLIRFADGSTASAVIDLSNTRRLRRAKVVRNPGPPDPSWFRHIPPGSPPRRQEIWIDHGRDASEVDDLSLAMLQRTRCDHCGARPYAMHLKDDGLAHLMTRHDPECPESFERAGLKTDLMLVPSWEAGEN